MQQARVSNDVPSYTQRLERSPAYGIVYGN